MADDYVRGGSWATAKPSPMMRPQAGMLGRKIGVYGMGEIGRKIAARVAAFETEVGYFSRSKHDVPYQYFPTLDALAEWCSVLMIAVRAGADTNHAVDANILKKLGKDGYVVNISRGSVIDQPALIAALTDQTIAGAGLDVYAKEPHAPDALTSLPNVVLSPHMAAIRWSRMWRCRTTCWPISTRSSPASPCPMRSSESCADSANNQAALFSGMMCA